MESIIVGVILIILGGLQAIRADLFIRFQIWSQRVIMGARYEPSARTYKVMRIVGAVIMIIGFLATAGTLDRWDQKIDGDQVYCTQEAKLCSDGSYVGRTGPECEFAKCPGE